MERLAFPSKTRNTKWNKNILINDCITSGCFTQKCLLFIDWYFMKGILPEHPTPSSSPPPFPPSCLIFHFSLLPPDLWLFDWMPWISAHQKVSATGQSGVGGFCWQLLGHLKATPTPLPRPIPRFLSKAQSPGIWRAGVTVEKFVLAAPASSDLASYQNLVAVRQGVQGVWQGRSKRKTEHKGNPRNCWPFMN